MFELSGDLGLGDEAVAVHRHLCHAALEALQRHVAQQVAIERHVDAAGGAPADLTRQP